MEEKHKKERAVPAQLKEAVLEKSKSDDWKQAVLEWKITGYEEVPDEQDRQTCVCGHEGLRFCYEITNEKTGQKLFPIGSGCIKKFGNKELTAQANRTGSLAAAFKKIRYGEYDLEDFPPAMIKYLRDNYCPMRADWRFEQKDRIRRNDLERLRELRLKKRPLWTYEKEDTEVFMRYSLTQALIFWARSNHVAFLQIGDCLPYARHEKAGSPGLRVNIPQGRSEEAKTLGLRWDRQRRCWYIPNSVFVEEACQDLRILCQICEQPLCAVCPDSAAINIACEKVNHSDTKVSELG